MTIKLIAISDTHGKHRQVNLPSGDVLIHAGDITMWGDWEQFKDFAAWLKLQSHKHKVIVAGNHDGELLLGEHRGSAIGLLQGMGATYLQDDSVELEGLKFYGSPYAPRYGGFGLMLDRGEPMKHKWAEIPDDVQILITHSPAHGILDQTVKNGNQGCEELAIRIKQLPKLKVHISGHLHEASGLLEQDGIIFCNASQQNEKRQMVNQPFVIEV